MEILGTVILGIEILGLEYWDSNTGYCNTVTPTEVLVFNVMTNIEDLEFPSYFYFNLIEFVSENDMTKEEKEEFEEFETIGGYLKEYGYKEAFIKSFEKASEEDVRKTFEIPNFSYDIFEEISGITKEMFDNKLEVKEEVIEENKEETIVLNGKVYKLVENE